MAKRRPPRSWLRIHAEHIAFRGMIGIIRLIPPKVVYPLAAVIASSAFLIDWKHRRRAIDHLLHAGVAKDAAEAARIGRANFIHLAKVGVDMVKFDQFLNPENLKDHLSFDGVDEKVDHVMRGKAGIIWVAAHFGNWEMSGLASSVLVKPLLSVMRPFDNPLIGKYIRSRRKKFRQDVVDKAEALRPLLKALKNGMAVGILSDQHAAKASGGVETIFFGHPARTHSSPAILHLKTGAPMMLGLCRRLDDDFHFEFIARGPFEIEPSGDKELDAQRLTQMFTSELEMVIRKYPEQWIWLHRRWLDINRLP